MSREADTKAGKKCLQSKCSKQFRDIKNAMQEHHTILYEMKLRIKKQQSMFEDISKQLAEQREIMMLFYSEYQALKKRQSREPLMHYIEMRDSMLKDISLYEENRQTNARGYKLLGMYVDQLTDILEDQDVEILTSSSGEFFNPEIQRPIERVEVTNVKDNNRLYRVFNCAYRWKGVVLKKMDVSVCVCSLLTEGGVYVKI